MSEKPQAKSKAFGVVIDPQKESANPYYELAQLQTSLLSHREFFVATIIHDKDRDSNNLIKTTHLHAYLESSTPYTKKQFLGLLVDLLKINENQISVKTDNNGFLLVQYLTHKNDQDKHQYAFEDIKTNSVEMLKVKYNQIYINPQERAERLQYDLENATTLLSFISLQGLDNAKKYQNVFNQVKKEQRLGLDQLANVIERLEHFIEWIEERLKVVQQDSETYKELDRIYNEIRVRFREFFTYRN